MALSERPARPNYPQEPLIFAGTDPGICWECGHAKSFKINRLRVPSTDLSWDILVETTNTLSLSQHSPVFPCPQTQATVATIKESGLGRWPRSTNYWSNTGRQQCSSSISTAVSSKPQPATWAPKKVK